MINQTNMKYFLTSVIFFFSNLCFAQEQLNWTIMYYAVGSNSSETDLLSDINEMKQGKKSSDYNVITLIDRIEGFSNDSTTLDGNFTDTRLYSLDYNAYQRLDGKEFFPNLSTTKSFEANMADAMMLKNFIQYCKKYYPAKHYLLVLRSHGNGVAMCPDAEGGTMDRLYPAEITNILTQNESVDILGLDVCSMAGLENLYQWRPENKSFSADYVIASSPLSGAWAYDQIFDRFTADPSKMHLSLDSNYFGGGKETCLNPKTATPSDFSKLIFEEIYDSQRWCSWGLFDNTKIETVKTKIDAASKQLAKESKTTIDTIIQKSLGYYHNTNNNLEIAQLTFPYLDAFHFWQLIANDPNLSKESKSKASEVCKSLDGLVVYSYYGQGFLPETSDFTNGKSGVYQIIPMGNKVFTPSGRKFWNHCNWFHPDDKSSDQNSYGQYDWCINGATRANNQVDNFFELLDYLFDDSNDEAGGVNKYQW